MVKNSSSSEKVLRRKTRKFCADKERNEQTDRQINGPKYNTPSFGEGNEIIFFEMAFSFLLGNRPSSDDVPITCFRQVRLQSGLTSEMFTTSWSVGPLEIPRSCDKFACGVGFQLRCQNTWTQTLVTVFTAVVI